MCESFTIAAVGRKSAKKSQSRPERARDKPNASKARARVEEEPAVVEEKPPAPEDAIAPEAAPGEASAPTQSLDRPAQSPWTQPRKCWRRASPCRRRKKLWPREGQGEQPAEDAAAAAEEFDYYSMSASEIRSALKDLGVPWKECGKLPREQLNAMLDERWREMLVGTGHDWQEDQEDWHKEKTEEAEGASAADQPSVQDPAPVAQPPERAPMLVPSQIQIHVGGEVIHRFLPAEPEAAEVVVEHDQWNNAVENHVNDDGQGDWRDRYWNWCASAY